jgi:hypothetical protein
MRALILITIFGLALQSCDEISFRSPQPVGKKVLSEIPEKLRGKFLTVEDDGKLSKDTVVIHSSGYYLGFYDSADAQKQTKDKYDQAMLGDSLVLKGYKGYYFLNFNDNLQWRLRVVKPEKNGDLVFMTPDIQDVDFKNYIKKLAVETPVDSFEQDGKTVYQISPKPAKLVELIEGGFFTKSILKKIK